MRTVVIKSFIITILTVVASYIIRVSFNTQNFLVDVGGLSAFATIFGTLYGIMTAFIIFEVWGQWNKISMLIDQEATGLERMFRLCLYLNDARVEKHMKKAIFDYASMIVKGKFSRLGNGIRNPKTGIVFREIFKVLRSIQFDDSKDPAIFPLIVEQGGKLQETRTNRINQSLTRLPVILNSFFYISSAIVAVTFIVMPFAQFFYQILAVGSISYLIAFAAQLIKDLDNPFIGHFRLTPEPFERTLKHIEEDY